MFHLKVFRLVFPKTLTSGGNCCFYDYSHLMQGTKVTTMINYDNNPNSSSYILYISGKLLSDEFPQSRKEHPF